MDDRRSPTILVKQRLLKVGVVIERNDGERFVFSDLGHRVYRWQAYERGVEWAKGWIDTNYRLRAHKPPRSNKKKERLNGRVVCR